MITMIDFIEFQSRYMYFLGKICGNKLIKTCKRAEAYQTAGLISYSLRSYLNSSSFQDDDGAAQCKEKLIASRGAVTKEYAKR